MLFSGLFFAEYIDKNLAADLHDYNDSRNDQQFDLHFGLIVFGQMTKKNVYFNS